MNRTSLILTAVIAIAFAALLSLLAFMMLKKPAAAPTTGGTSQNQNQESGQGSSHPQTATGQADVTAGWLTFSDSAKIFSFKYPANFGGNVWGPTQWPPAAVIATVGQDPVVTGCAGIHDDTGKTPTPVPGTDKNGFEYDLYTGSDIGAGQLYSTYCYVFPGTNGGAAVINFTIRSHSACGFGGCGAYCGTQYEAECTNLDRKAAIEDPIKTMADTFKFSGTIPAVTGTGATGGTIPPETTGSGKTVTLAENQTNIQLNVGDTFLLKLGEDYDWSPMVVDNMIVDRVKNIAVIRGAQGVYQALKAGDTDLIATGEPVCRTATPPCAAPSKLFEAHLVVR